MNAKIVTYGLIAILLLNGIVDMVSADTDTLLAPIIKVRADVALTNGKTTVEIVSVEQDTISPLNSPRDTYANFPSVDAKAIINFGHDGVSYWAAKEYTGEGTYELVLGFENDRVPKKDDVVKILVRVIDGKGKGIGNDTRVIIWTTLSPTPAAIPTSTPIVVTSTPTPSPTLSQVDSDGDGWSDEKERLLGTNPYSIDSDNDGINDPQDPNPTVPEKNVPGFEAVFAIIGLLIAVVYLINCKKHNFR